MKRLCFALCMTLIAAVAYSAPGDKRPAVTSAAIGLGTSSSATMASVTATTSVTAPAYNSTAADGYHYVLPYNSTAFAGTPSVGMIQTTPTGPQWYTGSAWEAIGSGGGGTWGSITGTLSEQTDLQAALDAISAGGITISTGTPTTAGAAYLNDTTHVLTVASTTGYTQFTGTHTAWDTTPAAFSFTDETDVVADGGQSCGAAITVSGINYPSSISTTGDTGYGYKVNGGTFTNASGTVVLNDSVVPCVNRSSSNSTATTATITIGGVSDTYSVTTAAGSACSSTPSIAYTDTATAGNVVNSYKHVGARYVGTGGESVCKIDFYVYGITGSLSGKTYTVRVYSTDTGTKGLVNLIGSSDSIDMSSVTAGTWVTATFSESVILPDNWAVEIYSGTPDYSNYIKIGTSASNTNSNLFATSWNSDLTYSTEVSYEPSIKIYSPN